MARNKKINLTGLWRMGRWYGNGGNGKWYKCRYFTKYDKLPCYWVFGRAGWMLQGSAETSQYETEFYWYPEERLLAIDDSVYEDDGFCSICKEDRYRVKRINRWCIMLYCLEDVEKEPDDYMYRVKLRRRLVDILFHRETFRDPLKNLNKKTVKRLLTLAELVVLGKRDVEVSE
ncbi:hypothetical protein LJC45_03550 [Alistipes sp. OttesenSCG-928-B03]|nr:hypothetical protein [Alistipes sp. OttesenSCG-928-B03]